jgi:outer membrane protein
MSAIQFFLTASGFIRRSTPRVIAGRRIFFYAGGFPCRQGPVRPVHRTESPANRRLAPTAKGIVRALVICILSLSGCISHPPKVFGVSATSPRPETPWETPPKIAGEQKAFEAETEKATSFALPKNLQDHLNDLSLFDIVDIALRANSQTRFAWLLAQAAAAQYGSVRGGYFPTISGSLSAEYRRNPGAGAGGGAAAFNLFYTGRTYSAIVSLNWLLFDFFGRKAAVAEAREAIFAANWNHNKAIQDVIFQVEQAYYNYFTAKKLLESQESAVREARINLDAARSRKAAGLATVADVLQAQTALSQELLSLATYKGGIMTTRGILATAMGLAANTAFDVNVAIGTPPIDTAEKAIGDYLAIAIRERPDLCAARAQAVGAAAHVQTVRAQELPSLSVSGTLGEIFVGNLKNNFNENGASINLDIPIFSGFSRRYNVLAARIQARAAAAGAQTVRDRVTLDVWNDYYNLQTAGQKLRAGDDLMASALENRNVAAGRYKAGVGTVTDLLTAQAQLESARAQQIQARAEWWIAAAQLSHDTGTLIGTTDLGDRGKGHP